MAAHDRVTGPAQVLCPVRLYPHRRLERHRVRRQRRHQHSGTGQPKA